MSLINDEHNSLVAALFRKLDSAEDDTVHAAIGICTEAGEVLDAVKKMWCYDQPLNRENVIEELGDIEFYMAAMRMVLGIDREAVLCGNIEKLNRRYPDGVFKREHAAARLDKQADGSK